jgi:hypothetical protein
MQVIPHKVTTSDGTLEFITHDVNNTEVIFHPDHPWLNDIRSMSKMLEGEINIPHGNFEIIQDTLLFMSECDECRKAERLQRSYKQVSRETNG